MTTSMWRIKAREIIAQVLAQHEGRPEPEIRRALRDAYPFGPRRYWPYKVWLDEVQRQRQRGRYAPGANREEPDPDQLDLF